MSVTRKCRWCFEVFEVLPALESRYHCDSCWSWITLEVPGTVKLRKQFTVRMPRRFRDIEHAQEKLSEIRIGK